jgi:hypothetical protein
LTYKQKSFDETYQLDYDAKRGITLEFEIRIQSFLTEDDIKQYVQQVIKKVKKPKMSNDGNSA